MTASKSADKSASKFADKSADPPAVHLRQHGLTAARRVVVKVGTQLLTHRDPDKPGLDQRVHLRHRPPDRHPA